MRTQSWRVWSGLHPIERKPWKQPEKPCRRRHRGARCAITFTIFEQQKELLQQVFEECGRNKKEATWRLGISRNTLYVKLKKYHITRPTTHYAVVFLDVHYAVC